MKIGINFLSFRSYQGTEVFAKHLISELLELDHKNEYVIFASAYLPEEMKLKADNLIVESININPEKTIQMGIYQQIVLPFKLIKSGITKFFAPMPSIPVFYTGKKIITIHDCAYDRFNEYKNLAGRLYIKSMYISGKYLCDTIITDSNFAKNELLELYNIKPEKIKVVYPAVPKLPHVDDAFINETKHRFNITYQYFLYIGITRPRKNITGLLQAFKLLVRKRSDIQLVLAGKIDTSFIDIEKEIHALGLEKHVIQTGFVSDKQKAAIYKGAIALSFPSYYEGFGIPVIEAQSIGTPVIASKTSSLPEVAHDGALYINPENIEDITNAMEKLLDNAQRKELIENGYKNVQRFSWKNSAAQLMNVINGE